MADSYPHRLASILQNGVLDQWKQGRPYREALGGLLSGDAQPLQGLLGTDTSWPTMEQVRQMPASPPSWDQMMSDPGMQAAMNFAPMGIGMIKTQFGRIPDTGKEIDKLTDALRKQAEISGNRVNVNSSNVSGSRYLTFPRQEGDLQVRISNHGDRYPADDAMKRFSVDAESGNTFEMARQWLKDQGINLDSKLPTMPEWVSRKSEYVNVYPDAVNELRKSGYTGSELDYMNALGNKLYSLSEKKGK
jgi:hypothetical protein